MTAAALWDILFRAVPGSKRGKRLFLIGFVDGLSAAGSLETPPRWRRERRPNELMQDDWSHIYEDMQKALKHINNYGQSSEPLFGKTDFINTVTKIDKNRVGIDRLHEKT